MKVIELSRKKEARNNKQQSQIAAIGKLSAVNENQQAEGDRRQQDTKAKS